MSKDRFDELFLTPLEEIERKFIISKPISKCENPPICKVCKKEFLRRKSSKVFFCSNKCRKAYIKAYNKAYYQRKKLEKLEGEN